MMLAYKQRQQEKRWKKAIEEIEKRLERIDEIVADYPDSMEEKIKELMELYLDYSLENREEKIPMLANGCETSIKLENPEIDVLMGFYDTYKQTNLLDIRILKTYYYPILGESQDDDFRKIMSDYNIDYSQYKMILLKLERLGLLESKNDIENDKNIDYIIDYLQEINKKGHESQAKRSLNRLKKSSRSESYKITPYGSNFIEFFSDK